MPSGGRLSLRPRRERIWRHRGELGGQCSCSRRLSGSSLLIQEMEVKRAAFSKSAERFMRVHVAQGLFATCVARMGVWKRISPRDFRFALITTRRATKGASVLSLHLGHIRLLVLRLYVLLTADRGKMMTIQGLEGEHFS